jgi:hypothetical protein
MVLLRKLAKLGVAELLQNIPFQLWILNAAAVVLLPEHIAFQQYGLPFGFITDRLSLCAALMMCATLAAAPAGKFEKIGLAAVAVVFFSFLYFDGRQLNRIEDRIDAVVQTLPAGERVVNTLPSLTLRSLCLQHDLDRACIGHCYSYANYEPPSRQFRVRALPGNRIVLANQPDVNAIVDGKYVVQLSDLPLHLVYLCGPNLTEVCLRPLHAGETNANPN